MTAKEQGLSIKRSEYAFITIMNKYNMKDVHNYMPKFEDTSIMNHKDSKNVKGSVKIVHPPPLTVIDLTVERIEGHMMADNQEQKAASVNETSEQQTKTT
jgi:hypothetical protein